jgi:hypothetical protein
MKSKKFFNYYRKLVLALHKLWQIRHILFTFLSGEAVTLDVQENKTNFSASNPYNDHTNDNLSGILDMPERPDLLISLEKIMLRSFSNIQSSDTLANAFSIFVIQAPEELVALNSNGSFLGIIKATLLYKKMPSSILDVPSKFRNKSEAASKEISHLILEIGRKKIDESLILNKPSRLFQTVEPLSSLLSEINSLYNYYLEPRIIPVFDKDKTIKGIVTYREIIKYIKQDFVLRKSTVEDLVLSKCLREYISVLTPEDTLATAEMLMEYTLADYVLVCDKDSKVIGYLNKIWISKLTHYSHLKFINFPLQDLAQPLDENIKFFTSRERLSNVIEYLIEENTVVVVSPESTIDKPQLRLITPLSVISFFLSSF